MCAVTLARQISIFALQLPFIAFFYWSQMHAWCISDAVSSRHMYLSSKSKILVNFISDLRDHSFCWTHHSWFPQLKLLAVLPSPDCTFWPLKPVWPSQASKTGFQPLEPLEDPTVNGHTCVLINLPSHLLRAGFLPCLPGFSLSTMLSESFFLQCNF